MWKIIFGWNTVYENIFSSPVHCGFFFICTIKWTDWHCSTHNCYFCPSHSFLYSQSLCPYPQCTECISPSPSSSPSLFSLSFSLSFIFFFFLSLSLYTPPSDLLCLCIASHGQRCGKGLHYFQSRCPSEWLWKQPPGPVPLPHSQSSPISSHHQAQRTHWVTLSPLILSLLSVAGHHCKHSIPWDQPVLQK